MILGCSAITISLVSLFIAIQHGKTEEKLVAASSWPFVVAENSVNDVVNGVGTFDLFVANRGVGPARIQSVRLLLDGHPVHNHEELLTRCCGYPGGDLETQIRHGLRNENQIIGVLTPRDTEHVLTVERTSDTRAQWQTLINVPARLSFFACYCSVLNECWTTDMNSTSNPRPVAMCERAADDYTN